MVPMANPSNPLHVGLMVPINNTTMERELLAWLPAGSTCDTQRIPRGKGLLTKEVLPEYVAQALALAKAFDDPAVDVVAYGCTAAGFISGPAGDAALQSDLAKVTGKQVVTTARSMVQALQDAGVKNIALVTPYLDAVNVQLKTFLAEGGIHVKSFNSFYAKDVDELGRIESHTRRSRLLRQHSGGVFADCSQPGLLRTKRGSHSGICRSDRLLRARHRGSFTDACRRWLLRHHRR